jgi:hypothetical protein
MKVVRLSALRTSRLYSPGNIPGTHICVKTFPEKWQVFSGGKHFVFLAYVILKRNPYK